MTNKTPPPVPADRPTPEPLTDEQVARLAALLRPHLHLLRKPA
jgi:hypothetical protein